MSAVVHPTVSLYRQGNELVLDWSGGRPSYQLQRLDPTLGTWVNVGMLRPAVIAAGAPVASLLPDTRRRLRFYVPETVVGTLQPGQAVEARCDGCAAPIRATIDFIAPQAEYTPPVIYSRGTREKLVFRVEAAPAPDDARRLRPGLPVDVRLAERRDG